MKLLILPRYARKGPSSRLRHYQFSEDLERAGFEVRIEPFLPDDYVDALFRRKRWPLRHTLAALRRRLGVLLTAGDYDLVWIEKEILPFLPGFAERLLTRHGLRMVFDYDDAWHLRYWQHPLWAVRFLLGGKIERLMRQATLVTAGNPYLVNVARASGAVWVEEVPTVLDTNHYVLAEHRDGRPVQIVWIGSSLNSRYLAPIAEALTAVCADGRAELVVVGGHPIDLPGVPVRFEPWTEETEAQRLAAADIGIMPLADTEWERGKCAFKIFQYMAAGLPVVASPVGINAVIVTADIGLLAHDTATWTHALGGLVEDVALRRAMGQAGRAKVEAEFSLAVWGPRVAALLVSAARGVAGRGEGRERAQDGQRTR